MFKCLRHVLRACVYERFEENVLKQVLKRRC